MRTRRILAAALAGASSLALAGCFTSPYFAATSESSSTAIAAIKEIPLPDGYAITDEFGGEASIDYQNPDHGFNASAKQAGQSSANVCATVIAYGRSLGATYWMMDPNYIPFPFEGHEAQAQIACVLNKDVAWAADGGVDPNASTAPFQLWGTNPDLIPGTDVGVFVEFLIGATSQSDEVSLNLMVSTAMDLENADPRMVEQSWDDAFAKLEPDQHDYYAALSAIGGYRAAHPKDDPMSEEGLTAALDEFEKSGPKAHATLVPAKDGGFYLQLEPAKEGYLLPVCVSLAPFDPHHFGVDDPGYGYTIGYTWNDTVPRPVFGSSITEKCPKP